MERACSMIGCNNTNDNLAADHFFQFPSDFDLCLTWVENCKTPKIFEDFVFGGALPCLKRFICYHHFHTDDFVDPERIDLGLKPTAVPHYFPIKLDQRWEECYIKDEVCCEDNDESWENVIDNQTNDVDNYLRTWTDPTTDAQNVTTPNEAEQETDSRLCKGDQSEEDQTLRKQKDALRAANRREQETEDEKLLRRFKDKTRSAMKRINETEEERQLRRQKNALRAAIRRKEETEEQREIRRLKDKARSSLRRKNETEAQSKIRKYNDAVRAAFRRNQESPEEKIKRRIYDMVRAAKKRGNETPEQREKRLKADRERAARRRSLIKVEPTSEEPANKSTDSEPQQGNSKQITDQMIEMIINKILS